MNRILIKSFFITFFFFANFIYFSLEASDSDMKSFLSAYYSSQEKTKGYPKLLYAMEMDYDREIAIKLLNSGENPNTIPSNLQVNTPLILAISREDIDLVSLMIHKGANVNQKAYYPKGSGHIVSPLTVAVDMNKQEDITEKLCSSKALVIEDLKLPWKGPWNQYSSPILRAIERNDVQKFKIMADSLSNQQISRKDLNNKNLLGYSCYYFQNKEEEQMNIFKYLIARGIDLETIDGSALSTSILSGNIELMKYVISFGANINFKPQTSYKNSPICAAISVTLYQHSPNRFDPLKLLLDLDLDLNFSYVIVDPNESKNATSPLGYAIALKANEAVQMLLNYGADANLIDHANKTPLMRAIEANNIEGVKLLISAGAKLSGPTFSPSTLIETGYRKGFFEIAQILIEAEAASYDEK